MRVNRSIFLGLSALVAALGMLGANGYFWWVAQSDEKSGAQKPVPKPAPHWPTVKDRDEFANLDKPTEWFSPYRALPDEEVEHTPPKDNSWRRYYPHESEAVEFAQADASDRPVPEPATPSSEERPAPLLFPNPAEPIEHSEPPSWLPRLIDQELPQASDEERRVWTQELMGFEPEVVLDILRMKKNVAGIVAPFPGSMPKAPPVLSSDTDSKIPIGEKFVPPPADVWSLETDSVSRRLQPSLAALERARGVVLNNLANLQTVGFKRSRVVLTPVPARPVPELLPDETHTSSEDAVDAGGGTELSATLLDPSQGPIKTTREPMDVAIEGPGFFQVRSGQETHFTRAGLWTIDEQGRICLAGSAPLKPLSPSITIPENADEVVIAADGLVTAMTGVDPRAVTQLGRIQLARFRNASGLKSLGGQLFAATPLSGPANLGSPQSSGFGALQQGALELANTSRDEEQEQFQQIHAHVLLLQKLVKESDSTRFPGPVARNPLSRTQRASAQTIVVPPSTFEPLRKLGEEGRNLIEDYLQSERVKSIKRTLGLK